VCERRQCYDLTSNTSTENLRYDARGAQLELDNSQAGSQQFRVWKILPT
jgi:hypothetical protein